MGPSGCDTIHGQDLGTESHRQAPSVPSSFGASQCRRAKAEEQKGATLAQVFSHQYVGLESSCSVLSDYTLCITLLLSLIVLKVGDLKVRKDPMESKMQRMVIFPLTN